ncbi:Adhesion G-protein coupled receptor G2 [Holothuria leucospilota]|uniref:Adhesion G-protein coupled receptor G2 n=1 Tax=Holothuria leucospilota TaxID=206669 RepID=A0A9Q0YJB4_HOLLE|nr:Adhesion G-protein coupled receptor G2 [Holothuria leucospilota]
MEATTSKNVSVPSVDTTTSIYGTTEKTTAEYATSDATNVQTTNPSKTKPSTKRSYITTGSYKVCYFERIYFSGVKLTFPTKLSDTSAYSVEVCGVGSTHGEFIIFANVTTENVQNLASEMAFLTSQTDDLLTTDVEKVANTVEDIVQTGSSSPNVTQSVVGIVNNVMEVDEAHLEDTGSAQTFIVSLERQISNLQKTGSENFTEVLSNVGVKAVKVDPSVTEAITFITVVSGDRNVSERLKTDLSDENTLLFNNVEEVKRENGNSDLDKLPISFFIYKDARLFQTSSKPKEDTNSSTGEEVVSQVIATTVEIENISIANLPAEDAIITRFLTNDLEKNSTTSMVRRCVFWKVNEEDGKSGSWSTEGCEMISESRDSSQTVCRCSHLTSFAVIFRSESTTYTPIASLDIITKVGTSLSVIGLTACILTLTLINCFLHPGKFLYFGLLLEILVTLIFNIVLFSLVVQRVVCRPILSTNSQKRKEIIIRIQHFLLFWVLLGLSWTFGFLLIFPIWPSITVTIEILFCIFTSLQGLILFIFICVKNPDVQKIFKSTNCCFRKKDSCWMKNRKGCYSVSDLHSKIEPANARVESLFRNHAMSEKGELSVCEKDTTYSTASLANSREEDHELSSERESDDNVNHLVQGINQFHQDDITLKQDRAPEPRERFRKKSTQHKSPKGTENSREEDHELSSERECEDEVNHLVQGINQFHQDDIMLKQDRAPERRERFRKNFTKLKSTKGAENSREEDHELSSERECEDKVNYLVQGINQFHQEEIMLKQAMAPEPRERFRKNSTQHKSQNGTERGKKKVILV